MHSERATQNVFDKSMATCQEDTVGSPSKKMSESQTKAGNQEKFEKFEKFENLKFLKI